MKDTLPKVPHENECAIVNFNTQDQPGTHWVCYYKIKDERIYFDSFGQITLSEIQKYLKKKDEDKVIQRNTDIVQTEGSSICGHLCLFVLKSLSSGNSFRDTLNYLNLKKNTLKREDIPAGKGITWTNELANELHKPLRHNFQKRYVFVRNVDDVWAADLVDMKSLSSDNDEYNYI